MQPPSAWLSICGGYGKSSPNIPMIVPGAHALEECRGWSAEDTKENIHLHCSIIVPLINAATGQALHTLTSGSDVASSLSLQLSTAPLLSQKKRKK